MSAPIQTPRVISYYKNAKNGLYPDVQFYGGQLIPAQNHLTAWRRKEVFTWAHRLGSDDNPSGFPATIARFRFRSGYGAKFLNIIAELGLDTEGAGTDPTIDVNIKPVGGATTTVTLHYGTFSGSTSDAPDDWSLQVGETAIDPATAYECSVVLNDNARLMSLCVHERGQATVLETTNYFDEQVVVADAPILDSKIQRSIEGLSNMLRQNGALISHWSQRSGDARTRTSATYINLIDNATTGTPAAADLGWRFSTDHRCTESRATVPVEFAVYGSMASGTGHARIIDTSGNTPITIAINSSTPQWWTGTGLISASSTVKYVPQFNGDGTNLLSIYGASIYEWET